MLPSARGSDQVPDAGDVTRHFAVARAAETVTDPLITAAYNGTDAGILANANQSPKARAAFDPTEQVSNDQDRA